MNTVMTFTAIYEGGVLHPKEPLPFQEGTLIEFTAVKSQETPILSADEAILRIEQAKTVEEWAAAANAQTDDDDDYDLLKALDENRRMTGDVRMLFPNKSQDVP